MGTIRQIRDRYKAAYDALPSIVAETVQRSADVLMDLNKDQLLQGRDTDGNLLSPTYLNDPYFDTPERARRYAIKKYRLESVHDDLMKVSLFGTKPTGVPNLLITGNWFHNHFFINVTRETYSIGSTGNAASDIEKKYNNKVFGLAQKSKAYFYFNFIRPALARLYGK